LKLALDHHYSPAIAEQLRVRGHDTVAAHERGWHLPGDSELLEACAAEGRCLLTNDVADFSAIIRSWAAEGRSHPGVLFSADASLPRSRATIGRFVEALDELMSANLEGLADRVHWLG
jgi:predicted nuclease of predicted toxin-antitoxin system